MNYILKFGEINELKEAFEDLYNAVSITLGPGGRLVLINPSYGVPFVTKDGVSVSNNINFDDTIKNTFISIIKQVSKKTCSVAGDGTTTSVVLAYNLYKKFVERGLNKYPVREFNRRLDSVISGVTKELKNLSSKVSLDDVYNIAYTSSNGDEEVSKIITDVFNKIGLDGSVTLGESKDSNTSFKINSGYQITNGFVSPAFINSSDTGECIQENAKVLVVNKPIVDFNELVPTLEVLVKGNSGKPLIIVALGYSPEVINSLVVNKASLGLNLCAVNAPFLNKQRIDVLYDIAAVTNSNVINTSEELRSHSIILNSLGSVKRCVISSSFTTFFDDENNEKKSDRIKEIKHKIEETHVNFDKEQLESRLSKLSGGVATIYAGGNTEAEQKECKDRIEDAVCAVRAGLEEGTVVGGGYALNYIANVFNYNCKDTLDYDVVSLVMNAIRSPKLKILSNADIPCPDDFNWKYGEGINAYTGETCNLIESGVLDPVKVTTSALNNAVSIFKLLIGIGCVVADSKMSGVGL